MISTMSVDELYKKIQDGVLGKDFILVDCREQGEWDEGHIAEAKFIPLSDFQAQSSQISDFEEKLVVMQCRSGKRSLQACQFLQGEGFEQLANLEGGILAWTEAGYPVTSA